MRRKLLFLLSLALIHSCGSSQALRSTKKVLVVVPSEANLNFHELAKPLLYLQSKGVRVDLVTPGMKKNIIQKKIKPERSYFKSQAQFERAKGNVEELIDQSREFSKVNIDIYNGIFFPGVEYTTKSYCRAPRIQRLVSRAIAEKKVLGLMGLNLCLVLNRKQAKKLGELKVTGPSKEEIKSLEKRLWKKKLEFPIHQKIRELNFFYLRGKSWYAYSVADKKVITSQNIDSEMSFVKKFYKNL